MVPPPPLPPEPVTLHASRRGLVAAAATPLLLVLFGGAVVQRAPSAWLGWASLLLGLGLGVVSALDVPRRVHLHADGVDRVCLLRTEHLPWRDLVALERQRGTFAQAVARRAGSRAEERATGRLGVGAVGGAGGSAGPTGFGTFATGGLVARGRGRRRWLLTDRMEGQGEHDRVVRLLAALDVPTVVRANRPPIGTPPTHGRRRT
ncbi:MAG: hypothetical protein ACLGIR_06625 [Actinomycetes bacterium]